MKSPTRSLHSVRTGGKYAPNTETIARSRKLISDCDPMELTIFDKLMASTLTFRTWCSRTGSRIPENGLSSITRSEYNHLKNLRSANKRIFTVAAERRFPDSSRYSRTRRRLTPDAVLTPRAWHQSDKEHAAARYARRVWSLCRRRAKKSRNRPSMSADSEKKDEMELAGMESICWLSYIYSSQKGRFNVRLSKKSKAPVSAAVGDPLHHIQNNPD